MANLKKVVVYSTPTCVYCEAAKDFFDGLGIKYEDFDVAGNLEKRREMIDKSGQMGVPVIVVGKEIIVGFDEEKIKKALKAR